MPESGDWFPNRLDLRVAKRLDRWRIAVTGNVVFVFGGFAAGWFGPEPIQIVGIGICAALLLALFGSWGLLPFVVHARRKQLEALGRRIGMNGCHVECRFYDGELELGRDLGFLGRDGVALRFVGARTRFSIGRAEILELPNPEETRPSMVVKADVYRIRVEIKAERNEDRDALPNILRGWPESTQPVPDHRLPPTTPEARSWGWYAWRAAEDLMPALVLYLCIPLAQIVIPESWKALRYAAIAAPFAVFAVAVSFAARRKRLRDEELLAARQSPHLSTMSQPHESADPSVQNAGA